MCVKCLLQHWCFNVVSRGWIFILSGCLTIQVYETSRTKYFHVLGLSVIALDISFPLRSDGYLLRG